MIVATRNVPEVGIQPAGLNSGAATLNDTYWPHSQDEKASFPSDCTPNAMGEV
jgi:hypothetical protein